MVVVRGDSCFVLESSFRCLQSLFLWQQLSVLAPRAQVFAPESVHPVSSWVPASHLWRLTLVHRLSILTQDPPWTGFQTA